ncbi:MAG TPA: Gfo/Idh/MocA family oxidoreductase [Aeromicrobium sp.]|nr:Gfo/Idh/MocA family oxidoreductase [Aeromicrobium sp.]
MDAVSRLRVGLVGFGLAGRVFHGSLLAADPAFDLGVIATGNAERQAAARHLHRAADVVATADELLARDLDLVVIASPPASHVALATAALDAGMAVVVDKPLCASAADGAELVSRAAAAARPLTVFQNRRWDSDFLTLQRVVRSGALGEVRQLESRFERWKPTPDAAKPWRTASPADAGGVVYDLGSHLVDQAIQLLGPVSGVHAELRSYSGHVAPDDGFLSLQHVGGGVSRLWMSSVAGQPGPRFRVLGSEGAFVSQPVDPQEVQLDAGMSPDDPAYGMPSRDDWPVVGVSGATETVQPERGDYPAFYRAVAEALVKGAEVPVDPRDSVEVVRILEAAHR